MTKPAIQQCSSCRSRSRRYRSDYPVSGLRAYVLIHAPLCSRLTLVQRHNRHRCTEARALRKSGALPARYEELKGK